jgi:hypothetical protein
MSSPKEWADDSHEPREHETIEKCEIQNNATGNNIPETTEYKRIHHRTFDRLCVHCNLISSILYIIIGLGNY